jgi:hypothetical protein
MTLVPPQAHPYHWAALWVASGPYLYHSLGQEAAFSTFVQDAAADTELAGNPFGRASPCTKCNYGLSLLFFRELYHSTGRDVNLSFSRGQRINPLGQRCYRRISHRSDGSPEASAVFKIVVYCGLFLFKTVLVIFSLIAAAKAAILLVLFVPASKCTPAGISQFSDGICNARVYVTIPDMMIR